MEAFELQKAITSSADSGNLNVKVSQASLQRLFDVITTWSSWSRFMSRLRLYRRERNP
jgi:hypothetical protein